jgi:hypothetical protein
MHQWTDTRLAPGVGIVLAANELDKEFLIFFSSSLPLRQLFMPKHERE